MQPPFALPARPMDVVTWVLLAYNAYLQPPTRGGLGYYTADFADGDVIGRTVLCKPRLCLDFGLLQRLIGTLSK